MITSVAVQAYLARIAELLKEQGFDPGMNVIYDAEQAQTDDWLSDELAGKHMPRKGMTTKEDVRKKPFMALFWTRSSLEPIIRRPYRLIDSPDEGITGPAGKSTVNAKFRIACAFVSNKAEAVEDLEEAFAARFQSTYNVPISLEFIYNSAEKRPEEALKVRGISRKNLVKLCKKLQECIRAAKGTELIVLDQSCLHVLRRKVPKLQRADMGKTVIDIVER